MWSASAYKSHSVVVNICQLMTQMNQLVTSFLQSSLTVHCILSNTSTWSLLVANIIENVVNRLWWHVVIALCHTSFGSVISFILSFLWSPYVIFLPCDFYLLSIFFFYSSPNLSGHRLDVYHTLTHGVALVRILYAGLKGAGRGSLQMQDPKKSPSGHHPTTLSGYIFATKACIDNRKKLVKQQYLLYMSPQYGELRPSSGWDRFVSFGAPQVISTGFWSAL